MSISATTIEHVLEKLDAIIDSSIHNNSNLGLFAYVYRRTTAEIASAIKLEQFEDNKRMERFDVIFANIYLTAFENYHSSNKTSTSWTHAFVSANNRMSIIQHVLLGMNVHINLDLAIATASVMEGKPIEFIEADYNKVNDILFQITDELQARLGRVSPLLFLGDWLGQRLDEQIVDFSMRHARTQAWVAAKKLWALNATQKEVAIDELDQNVLVLGKRIEKPRSWIINLAFKLISFFEQRKVNRIIQQLRA